jgi:CubicO group peptidase (beta-lactamase class C family)
VQIGSFAGMLVFQGVVLTSWGDITHPVTCRSMRKALLSSLYGIHVASNDIHLDWTLEKLGIDDTAPALTLQEKQATIADLLTSRSGVYHPSNYQTARDRALLPARGSHAPGTFWYYNNWDFNVLGTIFEHCTQAKIFEAFEQSIACPLQMQDYSVGNMRYLFDAYSVHPSYSFQLSARDLARFGLLYLRQGTWHNHSIVPQEWVQRSTSVHTCTSTGLGFGYMWWVCHQGRLFYRMNLPSGSYATYGFGGQYLLIIPAFDLVIVHQGNPDDPTYQPPGITESCHLLQMVIDAYQEHVRAY